MHQGGGKVSWMFVKSKEHMLHTMKNEKLWHMLVLLVTTAGGGLAICGETVRPHSETDNEGK